jgi:hypothetical protein
MATNVEEISKYTFNSGDELLLDANVWFFLYGPHRPGDPKAAVYSAALKGILAAKSRICLDYFRVRKPICSFKTSTPIAIRRTRLSKFQEISSKFLLQGHRKRYLR